MKYSLFIKLYEEAPEYGSVEMYIWERGWQDWMEEFDTPNLGNLLTTIYKLGNSSIRDLRDFLDISRAEMARKYRIPLRTLEDWESGVRSCSRYIESLIAYAIFMEIQYDNFK